VKEAGALFLLLLAPLVLLPHLNLNEYKLYHSCGFGSGIRMGKNPDTDPGSYGGMNIPYHFSESIETIFRAKNSQIH
jgi:hypothetical protein